MIVDSRNLVDILRLQTKPITFKTNEQKQIDEIMDLLNFGNTD